MTTDAILSLSALIGLGFLHLGLRHKGARDPILHRFLFGAQVMALLYLGRLMLDLTGAGAWRILVLIGAGLVPMALLLITEGLLRRHAPKWIKGGVMFGTALAMLSAFWFSESIDPARAWALWAFQALAFVLAGGMVIFRDRKSLSATENRAIRWIGLTLILFLPFAALDFAAPVWSLPLRPSALAVLVFCWLTLGLSRRRGRYIAIQGGGAVLMALFAFWAIKGDLSHKVQMAALVFATVILIRTAVEAILTREAKQIRDLRRRLAGQGADGDVAATDLAFLADQAQLIDRDEIYDLPQAELTDLLSRHPVLTRRAKYVPEDAELAAVLFRRFDATHILVAGAGRLLALHLSPLASSPRQDLELQLLQRIAGRVAQDKGSFSGRT